MHIFSDRQLNVLHIVNTYVVVRELYHRSKFNSHIYRQFNNGRLDGPSQHSEESRADLIDQRQF